jgi:sporulation protein YlmC with PRC-barrel domain
MQEVAQPKALSATTIIGDQVKNPQGEALGEIEAIMLDLDAGRVAYAVLSFGGFLGLGDKLFAIPWEALKLDPSAEVFILNADREMLQTAPGFDKDDWPQEADPKWLLSVYQHYGCEPYW